MDGCVATIGFVFFTALIAVPLLLLNRRQGRRIDNLEARLQLLERRASLPASAGVTSAVPAAARPAATPGATPMAVPAPTFGVPLPTRVAPVAPPAAAAVSPPSVSSPAASPPSPPPVVTPSPPAPAPSAPSVSPAGVSPRSASPLGPTPPRGEPGQGLGLERWLGVRGAAVLAGIVLALAGLYLFKYSLDRGLISPAMRVGLGVFAGLASLAGSAGLRRRGYGLAANGVAGGGLVILYASLWAAHGLYHLIGPWLGLGLMVLVTAGGAVLAARRDSQVIAALGLVGGFATPLMIPAVGAEPLTLWTYLLLLDAGLLALATRQRWPRLALAAVGATALHQLAFLANRLLPTETWLGLSILVVFAALFALAVERAADSGAAGDDQRGAWRVAQAGAVLIPFGLALLLALRPELHLGALPLGALLAVLSATAGWLGLRRRQGLLPLGAVGGSLAVLAALASREAMTGTAAYRFIGIVLLLAAIFELFAHLSARRNDAGEPAATRGLDAAAIAHCGFFLLLIATAALANTDSSPWVWLAGWLGLAGLLLHAARRPGRAGLAMAAGGGLALGLVALFFTHHDESTFPRSYAGVALLVALGWGALGFAGSRERRWRLRGATLLALALLFAWVVTETLPYSREALCLGLLLLCGLIAALVIELAEPVWGGFGLLLAILAHRTLHWDPSLGPPPGATLVYWTGLAAVALFTLLPDLASAPLRRRPLAWRIAAAAGLLWLWPLHHFHLHLFGDGAIGLLPLGLAALAFGAAQWARRRDLTAGPAEPLASRVGPRHTGVVWLHAASLALMSFAIPMQLDKEWITLGWALEGLALLLLWQRLPHPGLKLLAVGLFAAVTVRLIANPLVLDYHASGGLPVLNWLAYTYLVPAVALLVGAHTLRQGPHEPEVDGGIPPLPNRATAAGCVAAAIAVVFAWINLTVFDAFAEVGSSLRFDLTHHPARDLTLSLAWLAYALLLLGLGVAKKVPALRRAGLGFLIATVLKVFLYDLGELEDLYRVASLVGLALTLLLVSLGYQRFVVRAEARDAADAVPPEPPAPMPNALAPNALAPNAPEPATPEP